MPRNTKLDIIGKRFNKLTALAFLPDDGKYPYFLFQCDCGNTKKILAQSVMNGNTTSCGCYGKEARKSANTKHGHSGKGRTKTYNSWAAMMTRGEWGGHSTYESYGAKGINVCTRWHSFDLFLLDMGERPPGTSIDRIDNSKGYSPDNCRWATRLEQALNRTKTIKVKYNGESIPVYYLCEQLGLSKTAVRSRSIRRKNDYVLALRSMGVDCDYPDNCRWTSPDGRQLRSSKLLTLNGMTKTMPEWSRITGINKQTLNTRKSMGWSDDETLTRPVGYSYKQNQSK